MILAQNTASSIGPALCAKAKRAIHTPPPRNRPIHQRASPKRTAIVPLVDLIACPDQPRQSLTQLLCYVVVLTCSDGASRDNSIRAVTPRCPNSWRAVVPIPSEAAVALD